MVMGSGARRRSERLSMEHNRFNLPPFVIPANAGIQGSLSALQGGEGGERREPGEVGNATAE